MCDLGLLHLCIRRLILINLFGDLLKANQITKTFLLHLAVGSETGFNATLYYKAMPSDYEAGTYAQLAPKIKNIVPSGC